MKITRSRLRKLISETIYNHPVRGNFDAEKGTYDYLNAHPDENIQGLIKMHKENPRSGFGSQAAFLAPDADNSQDWEEMEDFARDINDNFRSEPGSLSDSSGEALLRKSIKLINRRKDDILKSAKAASIQLNHNIFIGDKPDLDDDIFNYAMALAQDFIEEDEKFLSIESDLYDKSFDLGVRFLEEIATIINQGFIKGSSIEEDFKDSHYEIDDQYPPNWGEPDSEG